MSSIVIKKHREFPITAVVFSIFFSIFGPLLAAGLVLFLAALLGIL